MASIYKVNDGYNSAENIKKMTPYIYNLSHSVGKGGANQKMDVLLVQKLLNIIYVNSSPLNPSGHFDHQTSARIGDFQSRLKTKTDRGNMIKADGRLDPLKNHGIYTPSNLFIYAIFFLNGVARMTDWRKYLRVCVEVHLHNSEALTNEFIDYYGNTNMPAPAAFCQVKDFFK